MYVHSMIQVIKLNVRTQHDTSFNTYEEIYNINLMYKLKVGQNSKRVSSLFQFVIKGKIGASRVDM